MATEIIEGEVVDAPKPPAKRSRAKAKTNGELAKTDDSKWTEPNKKWPHQWVEFMGDRLAVRKPTMQALAAYSLSASRFVEPQVQNDISGLFIARHMSPDSYARVMDRFMNGDDPDYNEQSVGELMRMVVELTTNALPEKANRAQRRHPTSKG
jgi:hypothetical protein